MFRFFSKKWMEQPINRNKVNDIPLNNTENIEKPNILEKIKNINFKFENKNYNLENINKIEDFYELIKNFSHPLKKTCKNTVISSGPIDSKIMIIGEAPGSEEDEQSLPFVGDSGKLLNKMLLSININREEVYVTNLIFFRPPQNRTPSDGEIEEFRPLLKKHIELIKPKIIFILGSVALKSLFDNTYMITKVRGSLLKYNDIPIMATFHPSYIIRLPKQKILVWEDLQKFKQYLNDLNILN